MRILFLLTQDLESPSGLGRYWPIAKSLAALGNQVHIAALHSNWKSIRVKKYIQDGVLIEYVAPMHVKKSGNQKQYYSPMQLLWISIRATLALTKVVITTSQDIIYIGKPHPMNSIAGLLASKLKKSLLCLDCDDYEAGSNRFTQGWQKDLVAFFEMKMPRMVRLVSTNTHFMISKLLAWGCSTENIFYLPNGIDKERFLNVDMDRVKQLRTRLNLDGKRVVLYLGSLSLTNHPVNLLLQAFKIVTSKLSDMILLVVGSGEDYQELIQQAVNLNINQCTYFVGRVEPCEVAQYYALADLAIDPVYDDPASQGRSPLKLFESWACGVPFVTSPVGDREILLKDPIAGELVEPAGDPVALADGILHLLKTSDYAKFIRQNGLEKVQNYTWDRLAIQLEKQLLSIR